MSKIRECFVSRFSGGVLLEADYSQLEIIALAHLSGDPQMASDIRRGVDLHTIRAATMYNIPKEDVTKQQRQTAKVFSFQLQYGAGPNSMAASCGVAPALAKKFIEDYYNRYPDVKKWQEKVAEEYQTRRRPSAHETPMGLTAGMGWHLSPTGRRYVMYEDDNPFYKEDAGKSSWYPPEQPTNFSPTKMKNYPVQGFATGDIVPMVLGEVMDWLSVSLFYSRYKMINTVHDSILFDCSPSRSLEFLEFRHTLKTLMESAPAMLKKNFGIDFTLPLKVDFKVGNNWGTMKEITCP